MLALTGSKLVPDRPPVPRRPSDRTPRANGDVLRIKPALIAPLRVRRSTIAPMAEARPISPRSASICRASALMRQPVAIRHGAERLPERNLPSETRGPVAQLKVKEWALTGGGAPGLFNSSNFALIKRRPRLGQRGQRRSMPFSACSGHV